MTDEAPGLSEALRTGLRRASIHMLKAGYEVLSGVGALIEELRHTGGEPEVSGPTRIPVEPDPGPERVALDGDPADADG